MPARLFMSADTSAPPGAMASRQPPVTRETKRPVPNP
jgi:hypothetical protein